VYAGPAQPEVYDDNGLVPTAWNILVAKGKDGIMHTVKSSEPIARVIRKFVENRVGLLVVLDDVDGTVRGVVCERDVILVIGRSMSQSTNHGTAGQTPASAGVGGSSGGVALASSLQIDPAWANIPVSEVMTPSEKVLTAFSDDSPQLLMSILCSAGFRYLPVIDRTETQGSYLVGVLSLHDILSMLRNSIQNGANLFDTSGTLSTEDYLHRAATEEAGGTHEKWRFLNDIRPRTGIPSRTRVFRSPRLDISRFQLYLESGAAARPHPWKQQVGSEDSYFAYTALYNHQHHGNILSSVTAASSDPSESNTVLPYSAIGITDGVSSWKIQDGVDAGKMARRLLTAAEELITQRVHEALAKEEQKQAGLLSDTDYLSLLPTAAELLEHGWKTVIEEGLVGSTTACIAVLNPAAGRSELKAANLGDSGFLVLRMRSTPSQQANPLGGRSVTYYDVVYRSQPQLREFDRPLQLGRDITGSTENFEQTKDAALIQVPVKENDLIIMATDGVFDNMFDAEICKVVNDAEHDVYLVSSGMALARPEVIAEKLMNKAYELSLDKNRDSPFALLAKDNLLMYSGGRRDDVTVVVSRVKRGHVGTTQILQARDPGPEAATKELGLGPPVRWQRKLTCHNPDSSSRFIHTV